MNYRALLIAPLAALVLSAGATGLTLPDGWRTSTVAFPLDVKAGPKLDGYEIGIDTALSGASPSLTVRSRFAQNPAAILNVGRAFQTVTGYAGQRVRFSGQVRAEAASRWAGLFLGLGDDDVLMPVMLGQPGVEDRLPLGAAVPAADGVWREVSVVLDVPADAPFLTLGVALVGEGQVWVRELKFDVVGPELATSTTPVGIDWAQGRRSIESERAAMALLPPQPLRNAALD